MYWIHQKIDILFFIIICAEMITLSMLVPCFTFASVVSGRIEGEFQQPVQREIIVHNWYDQNSVIQDYANYAYNIWGMDFVKMIECENGQRDPQRVSKTHDYWLCQLNYRYNKKFINSPEFDDPYKQLDYCYEKFQMNPKLRYGPDRKIEGQKCSDYVSDRFDIVVSNTILISENIN